MRSGDGLCGNVFEEGFEFVGSPLQHAGLLDVTFEDFANEGAVVFRVDGDGFEGSGPGGFVFIEVGRIIDEGEGAGLMNETKLRDETHGAADGSNECVVGGGGDRDGTAGSSVLTGTQTTFLSSRRDRLLITGMLPGLH